MFGASGLKLMAVAWQNYSAGLPSRTLYLKNLAKQVREEDLVRLFGMGFLRGRAEGEAQVESSVCGSTVADCVICMVQLIS